MKRYVVKNEKNKTYKNMFGVTDYDIPMFGFKSALLILGATMLSLIVCVNCFHYLHIDFRLPNAIISSIVCGLSVAYSQFYIERKKGMCKSFWIVAGTTLKRTLVTRSAERSCSTTPLASKKS